MTKNESGILLTLVELLIAGILFAVARNEFTLSPSSMAAVWTYLAGNVSLVIGLLVLFVHGNRRDWWFTTNRRPRPTIWGICGLYMLLGLAYFNAWSLGWSTLPDLVSLHRILQFGMVWIMTPFIVLYTIVWVYNRIRNRNSTELEEMYIRNGPHGT